MQEIARMTRNKRSSKICLMVLLFEREIGNIFFKKLFIRKSIFFQAIILNWSFFFLISFYESYLILSSYLKLLNHLQSHFVTHIFMKTSLTTTTSPNLQPGCSHILELLEVVDIHLLVYSGKEKWIAQFPNIFRKGTES